MPRTTGRVSAAFLEAGGETRLGDRYHAYPLKIAKAFPFDDGQLGVYVMDASPGIMSGDRYELDWHFGENTKVYVTNQSYTKVHPVLRSADGSLADQASEQRQTLTLARGSVVEYMPEPLMLYKDAYFYSETEVRMEPGSVLILSETVCPGRTQRGELFQYGLYRSELKVTFGSELIFCAKQRVEPSSPTQKLDAIGAWGPFTHYGALYVFSEQVDAGFADRVRDYLNRLLGVDEETAVPFSGMKLYSGVSRTYKYGLVVSVMGCKVYEIQQLLEAIWKFIRRTYFVDTDIQIRK